MLAQTESVFALANGHLGFAWQFFDEGEPHGLPGTYLNSVYESAHCVRRAGYGYPEFGQTVINVTNGKLFRLLVDDEPFDLRSASCASRAGSRPAGRAR